jgi:hypothetical protein
MAKATETFVKAELTKDIPGYPAGSRFFLKKEGNLITVWKTSPGHIEPTEPLGLPFDPKFFKELKTVDVHKGYYAVKSASKGNICHPNHLLRVNEFQSLNSKHGMVKVHNLSMCRMVEVKFSELVAVTPYTFINSSGIISHDYIERDLHLYQLRVALGIGGTESQMREHLTAIKNEIL